MPAGLHPHRPNNVLPPADFRLAGCTPRSAFFVEGFSMSEKEIEARSVLYQAIAAATGWWLADLILMSLTTAQLVSLALEVASDE